MPSPRTLTIVPIAHTQADLGTLAPAAAQAPGAADRAAAISGLWTAIEHWAQNTLLTAQSPRHAILQDGLPIDADVPRLVAEVAAAGSRNHALLLKLMQAGHTVLGTESPELLIEELSLAKRLAANPALAADPRIVTRRRALLEMRDRFIADRAAAVVTDRTPGVLFIGAAHDVASILARSAPDIALARPALATAPTKAA